MEMTGVFSPGGFRDVAGYQFNIRIRPVIIPALRMIKFHLFGGRKTDAKTPKLRGWFDPDLIAKIFQFEEPVKDAIVEGFIAAVFQRKIDCCHGLYIEVFLSRLRARLSQS